MTAPWMPPLPEPVAWADRDGDLYVMPERQNWHPPHQMLYTTDQMRQAQADAARAALEQAAKVCDEFQAVHGDMDNYGAVLARRIREITP